MMQRTCGILAVSALASLCACDQQALAPPDLVNPFLVSGTSHWSEVQMMQMGRRFESVWVAPTGEMYAGHPRCQQDYDVVSCYETSVIMRLNTDGSWFDTGYDGDARHIWGTSRNNIFVAEGLSLRHLSGHNWLEVDIWVNHLFGLAEDDIFGVGYKGIYHYDGAYWDLVYPMERGADAIWASADHDVFTIDGNVVTAITAQGTAVYNVKAWLEDIWGFGAGDVWAVGSSGLSERARLFHFNGSQWSEVGAPGAAGALYGVWGRSTDDIYAVGRGGTMIHYDGESWEMLPRVTSRDLYDVWGTDTDRLYAVGENRRVVEYDGQNWRSILGNQPGYWPEALWVKNEDEYIIADYQSLSVFANGRWEEVALPYGESLQGVWGTSIDSIFVATYPGNVLLRTGTVWSEEYSPPDARLFTDIQGCNNGDLVVVGPGHVVERVMDSWTDVPLSQASPRHLWVDRATGDAVAVGDNRYLLTRTNGSWKEVAAPPGTRFKDVWGSSINDVYLLAFDDVYHFNGANIVNMEAPHGKDIDWLTGNEERLICTARDREIHRVNGEWRTYEASPGGYPWFVTTNGTSVFQLTGSRLLEWGGISED